MSDNDFIRGFEDGTEHVLEIIRDEMEFYFNNGDPEKGKIIERLLETVMDSLDNL